MSRKGFGSRGKCWHPLSHVLKTKAALRGLGICEWLTVVFVTGKAAEVVDCYMNEAICCVHSGMKPLLWSALTCCVHETLF